MGSICTQSGVAQLLQMLLVRVTVGQPVREVDEEVVVVWEDAVLAPVALCVEVTWATARVELPVERPDE